MSPLLGMVLLAAPPCRAKPVDTVKLAPGVLAAARADIAAGREERGGSWDDPPEATPESLRSVGLEWRDGALKLNGWVDCCTWAENHNLFDLEGTVKVPVALKAYVPDASGWFTKPGCGRVRHHVGHVEIEVKGAKKAARVGPLPTGRVVGVAWIAGDAPALRRRGPDEKLRAELVKAPERHRL